MAIPRFAFYRVAIGTVLALVAVGGSVSSAVELPGGQQSVSEIAGCIADIASDSSWVRIVPGSANRSCLHAGQGTTIPVSKEVRESLKQFRRDDLVVVRRSTPDGPLASMAPQVTKLGRVDRLIGAIVPVAFLVVLGLLFRRAGVPLSRLIVGKDGRYSNSKVQMALWFGVLLL